MSSPRRAVQNRPSPRLRLLLVAVAAVALVSVAVLAVRTGVISVPSWTTAPTPAPTMTYASPTTPEVSSSASPTPTAAQTPTPAAVALGTTGEALQDGLREGLALTSWPADLDPFKPGQDGALPGGEACAATDVADPTSCTFGSSTGPEIVVVGDAQGITLLPAVVAAYGQDHRVRGLTKLSCAVNGLDADYDRPEWAIPCVNHRLAVIDYVNRAKPQVVFLSEGYYWSRRLLSGADGQAAAAEWAAADRAFVDAIAPSGTQIVLVSPSLDGTGYYECYRDGGSPAPCTTGIPSWWAPIQEAERHIGGTTFLDTLHWYCVDGRCPLISTASGHTLLKVDYLHVTHTYSRLLAADLKYRVAALGVTT